MTTPSTDENIAIALAANDCVFDGLLVSACSIARYASPEVHLDYNILDGGITESHYIQLEAQIKRLHAKSSLRRFQVDESTFHDFPEFHGCYMAYARLLLPDLLPDQEHVIYCDTDFLWISDIADLWRERDATHPLISARDNVEFTEKAERQWFAQNKLVYPEGRYFCSGLCLFNLRIFREQRLANEVCTFIRERQTRMLADQTALNAILATRTKLVANHWQVIPRFVKDEIFTPPVTIHYAGENPWKITYVSKMLTDAQLLWFRFDATLRHITVWQSLRRYYSPGRIIIARLLFLLIMSTPITRALFDRLLLSTNRGRFRETISRRRFAILWKMLSS